MKKKIMSGVLIILVSCTVVNAYQKPGLPVVFAMNRQTLANNRIKVQSRQPAIMDSYKLLLRDADKALQFGPVSVMEKTNIPPSGDRHDYMSLAPYYWPDPSKPDGMPYIRMDGQTNPEVKAYKDKEYLPRLCSEVHTLALAYYFSGENHYSEHATKLLRVWFLDTATRMNPNLNFGQAMKGHNTGRGAGLIDTRHFVKVIDAIGLLQGSSHWSEKDQQGMKQWFGSFLTWMQESAIGKDEMDALNNHGAWYDVQRLSFALFTGNQDLAKKIVLKAHERLDTQMDDRGKFPREMERTISLHYTVFVMNAFFTIAQMSETIGIDFWNYTSDSGKSLRKGFEALHPYIIKDKQWEGQQIKEFDFEETYPLLALASDRFGCNKCRDAVKTLAGDKAKRLRVNLIY